MNKVRLLVAIIIVSGVIAAIEAVCLARRAAVHTPTAPAVPTASAVAASPLSLGRGWHEVPGEGLRLNISESDLAAPTPVSADAPESAVSADSAAPASDSATPTAEELAWAHNILAEDSAEEYTETYILQRLKLTDLQRQLGKDAIDKIRDDWKAGYLAFVANGSTGSLLRQKVRDLRNLGQTDDQIAGLIRHDMEHSWDRPNAQLQDRSAAILQLQPILMPDQVKTLNKIIAEYEEAIVRAKKDRVSDEYLKNFVQCVK
jgi:hypothetical protein